MVVIVVCGYLYANERKSEEKCKIGNILAAFKAEIKITSFRVFFFFTFNR